MGRLLLILTGVVLAILKATRLSFKKEELTALFAAMSFRFANTNDRVLLKSLEVYSFVFLAFVIPALFILTLNPHKLKKMRVFMEGKVFIKMLLLCVVYAASAITFFSALQVAPSSSQVVTINLTSVVVIVFLSIIFLKERENIPRKILGAISSFLGLLLVS